MAFSITAIVFIIISMIQYLDYQKCIEFESSMKPPPMGGFCYGTKLSSNGSVLIGMESSVLAITMLVIYLKKW